MIRADEFIYYVRGDKPEPNVRLGTIDAAYTAGRPQVQFDGESVSSTKTYPYLGSYTPVASDRVMLVRAGHSWVIVGEII